MKRNSTVALGFSCVMAFVLLLASCNTEDNMIKKARKGVCDVELYFEYLEAYPDGKYVEEANAEIVGFAQIKSAHQIYSYMDKASYPLKQQLAEIVYHKVSEENELSGWYEYMCNVPSEFHKDAQAKIDSIENERWGTESRAWATASEADSISTYKEYCNRYPNGKHKKQAEKRIIDFEVADVFAGDYGEMPSMEKTGYSSGGSSKVVIENSTSYTLTILYSGDKASEKLIVQSGGTGRVALPNGRYRIAASVDAGSVRSYAGVETLSGGEYSSSYYIRTERY